ncbi:SLAM family member 8 isoform X2 [Cheilinus undulatus]|uniref:SLAM family member 8 isoform X2 n=1 Tax=Cheilinus undulatus TaxID=241271 RepID=UPI001BD496E8|nr:SLAM family member 8 isoform X2 [Cheilinus undulatus]
MAGGRLHSLSLVFKCSIVLFSWMCLHDVEAFSCQHVIHKKVGDSVELLSCLPTEGVTAAKWRYGVSVIADKYRTVDEKHFKGRLEFDHTNFSLTIKELTQQDSGEFIFSSDGKTQNPTVTVTLKVHESITHQPDVTGNSTWNSSTNSCTVLLECSSDSHSDISYNWTVERKTSNGSRLQYIIRTQDKDTEFNCTIYNPVSKMSTSKTVKCSEDTQKITKDDKNPVNLLIAISVVGVVLMIIIVAVIAVAWHCIQSKGSDPEDHTVYADITEVTTEDGMKPCSVYETIDNIDNRVTRNTQVTQYNQVTTRADTVYDKIQLERLRKMSISPYQEIS